MPGNATTCVIALGGNTGPVERTFDEALDRLSSEGCCVVQRSRCYRSVPMGSDAGSEFVNAAAVLTTGFGAQELLTVLQGVEDACGRTRSRHWGPRTLDLDLLFFGQEIICTPQLTVPHAGLWYRRFVLDPLVEIVPDWCHPVNGQSVRMLHARLLERPLVVALENVHSVPSSASRFDAQTVRILQPSGADEATDAPVFCRISTDTAADRPPSSSQVDAESFRIVVHPDDLDELLGAVLAAALGE